MPDQQEKNGKAEGIIAIIMALIVLGILGSLVAFFIHSVNESNHKYEADKECVAEHGQVIDHELVPLHRQWNGSQMATCQATYTLVIQGKDPEGNIDTFAFDVDKNTYDQRLAEASVAR